MAGYTATLKDDQKNNIVILMDTAKRKGITNHFAHAGFLAVVSKESAFRPVREASYKNTPNERIRQIFGSRVAHLSEAQLTAVKADDVKFFNTVYGLSKYGQTASEGYKFRGGAYNQITFKNMFDKIGKRIGVDLLNHPELIERPDVAAKATLEYFIIAFESPAGKAYLASKGIKTLNDFKSAKDALDAFFMANRGRFTPITSDVTGGYQKAAERVGELLTLTGKTIEENKGAIGITALFFLAGAAAYWKRESIKQFFKNNKTK